MSVTAVDRGVPRPASKARSRPTKPWSRTSPDREWDDVVIGSGIGGMTAAALLAKLGRRVLVLEQHYVPGGFTHSFPRKGYVWDVGVHAVGEVTRKAMPGRLLHALTDGRLRWHSLGPVYDAFHFPDGFRIDFPDSPAQFRANLVEAFPNEERAIDDYLSTVREVAGTMRSYYLGRAVPRWLGPVERLLAGRAQRFLEQNAADAIASFTDDPRLRTVLTAQWGYYGVPPSRAGFAVQALVTRHFLHGGYYPEGGSGEIARQLLQTVADNGGWTRILADVDEILIERGRAVGVRLQDGEEIRARRVISAVGPVATARRLLPEHARDAHWAEEARMLDPGPAHVCLYLGFKGDITRAGASGANQWFYNTWNTDEEVWEVDADPLGPASVLYCSFPSLKDPRHDPGPEVRHTGEVVTFVPWRSFARWRDEPWRKRGEDYAALKKRMQDSLLEQFLARMPELAPMLDYVELSTPVSTHHFCRPLEGSIYGLEPTPERFRSRWLKPRAPVRGLFFAGCDAGMVGVVGALSGGALAVLAAEPVRTLRYFRSMTP